MKNTVKCEIVKKEPCTTRETRVINGISFAVIKRFYYNKKLEKHCCRVTVRTRSDNGFLPGSLLYPYDGFDNIECVKKGVYRERSYFFMNDSLLFLQHDVFMFLYDLFEKLKFIIETNQKYLGDYEAVQFLIENVGDIKVEILKEYFYDMDIKKYTCRVTAFIKADSNCCIPCNMVNYAKCFFNDVLSVNWGLYRGGYRRSSWIINDKNIDKLTDKVERYIQRELSKF